jgi:hypothetical protein
MARLNQLTKMAVDQSCNRFQISLIRYLGLSHQQLPFLFHFLKRFLKLTFYFHQHFHLLCSIVHMDRYEVLQLRKMVEKVLFKWVKFITTPVTEKMVAGSC